MRNPNGAKSVFIFAGIVCFLLAAVVLHSFKGRFVQETEKHLFSSPVVMEDTIDVTIKKTDSAAGQSRQVVALASTDPVTEVTWSAYLTGAVKNPGVYHIASKSRVYQALNAAGGFAADANKEAINLAAMMEDGIHIHFPRKGERSSTNQEQSFSTSSGLATTVGVKKSGENSKNLININTAEQQELETISGVGPKTAQSIITHRETNGNFNRVEDLMLIKGIGAKKYDGLKNFVTVAK